MPDYEQYLHTALAELMAIDPAQLSLTTPLTEQGVDSLIGLRLARKIQDLIGDEVEVELEWIFDYPSIAELAQFLTTRFGHAAGDATDDAA